ncbi:MAG: hypothetical protein L0387_39185 [Acidobacteria bacterium]|nr:hypothetical protein [Acidobacteriota bacterium]
MAPKKRIQDTVRVECYRMSPAESRDLKGWLRKKGAVAGFKTYTRKAAPGGPELGELIGVVLRDFFLAYAGEKILDYVYDQVRCRNMNLI